MWVVKIDVMSKESTATKFESNCLIVVETFHFNRAFFFCFFNFFNVLVGKKLPPPSEKLGLGLRLGTGFNFTINIYCEIQRIFITVYADFDVILCMIRVHNFIKF